MKKKLFCFTFLIISSSLFSQNTKIQELDSLSTYKSNDSIRVKLLIKKSNNLTYENAESAMHWINQALELSKDIKWAKGELLALRQKGVVYYTIPDNLNAMEVWQQALKINLKIKDKLIEASLHNNLANIYADMKLFDKALNKYNEYLSIAKGQNKISDQIKALTNIAGILSETERTDKAILLYNESLSLAKAEQNDFFIAAITNNMGLAYKRQKEYQSSLDYYYKAYKLADRIKNKYFKATTLNSLGKVSVLLKNYEKAKKYGEEALTLAQEFGAVEWQADSWQVLGEVYEYEKETAKALNAYKNYSILRDSVITEGKKAEVTRKEMVFKLEIQELKSKSEIEHQKFVKNTSIFGGGSLVLVTVISFILYRRKELTSFKAKVADTELKALRAQMNPHFIFNTLNSISDYITKNDIDAANNYLIKFSKLMRQTLESSEEKEISLKDDIEMLKTYLSIESKRLNNSFSYQINVDPKIDIENTLVPPLILQPFIENSIWHGVSKLKEGGRIIIEIKKEDSMLICSVEDNGIGIQNKTKIENTESHSMGIKLTKSRIEIINKLKKSNGNLTISNREKGLRVEVKLPLELAF